MYFIPQFFYVLAEFRLESTGLFFTFTNGYGYEQKD